MMTGKFRGLAAVSLAVATAISAPAWATESGVYIGVGLGNSHIDLGDTSDLAGLPATLKVNESDTGKFVTLGYRFNPMVGLEVSYTDLGAATMSLANTFTFAGVTINSIDASVSMKGTVIAVVGAIPVGNWEFSGRLGAFLAKTEISGHVSGRTISSPVQILDLPLSESASTTETLAALGVGYTFADHYHVKVEWARIPKVGDKNTTGEGDATLLSLGLQYRF
jgi:hypothetical protein